MKKNQRNKFLERQVEIKEIQKSRRDQKICDYKLKMQRQLQKKSMLLEKTNSSGGVWLNAEQIDSNLSTIVSDQQKRDTLYTQLQFRKVILGQKHTDTSLFNRSKNGIIFSVEKLKENLLQLVCEIVKPVEKNLDGSVPVQVLDQHVFNNTRNVLQINKRKSGEKRKVLDKEKPSVPDKQRKVQDKEKASVSVTKMIKLQKSQTKTFHLPEIDCAEDLLGKLVMHNWEDQDGEITWWEGVVCDNSDTHFEIKYATDGYKKGYIGYKEDIFNEFVELKEIILKHAVLDDFFPNKKISILYRDDKTMEEYWCQGLSEDVDKDDNSEENPDFFVKFDSEIDEDQGDAEDIDRKSWYMIKLIEEYSEGSVRLIK